MVDPRIILVCPFGRAGNQVFQAIHAIGYARASGHRVVMGKNPPLLPALDFDFSAGRAKIEIRLNTFYLGTPEMNGFQMTLDEKAHIARHFLTPKLRIDPLPTDDDTLVIHLRSGDIMIPAKAHPRYTPLPSCFYEKILQEQGFQKVVVVTEPDRIHPCLSILVNRYGASVVDDPIEGFSRLLGAKHLCVCVSTFSGSAALCSLHLKTLYCADEQLNPFRLTAYGKKPEFCGMQFYRVAGLSKVKWTATPEQTHMLTHLPKESCVRVDWEAGG